MTTPPNTAGEIVIVTGNNGLIGRHVVDRLVPRYQVVGFDRDGNPQPRKEVECVCVDVTSDASVSLGLDRVAHAYGTRIASVVHLAAYYDFSGEPSPMYDEVNVKGTGRLLHGLRGFEVGQFIFSSTMLMHAPTEPGRPINEDSPLEPKWDYPKSKVNAERLINSEHGEMPAVHLRIAGVYSDRCDSIPLAHQIDRVLRRTMTSHVFPGDVSHGQSFVHLDDVVESIALAIEKRHALPGEAAILIGEPQTASYQQLQDAFGGLLHDEPRWRTTEIPKAVAKTGAWVQNEVADLPGAGVDEPFIKPWMIDMADDHYELDISRARELLGWTPQRGLLETLPKMIQAMKRDPAAWYEHHKIEPPSKIAEAATASKT